MPNLPNYSALKAVILNCSLKRDAKQSHTQLLLNAVTSLMQIAKVDVSTLHMADHNVPPGVYPDMTDHGYEADEWPDLWKIIKAADILIIGTPIWLGVESSICRIAI
ncbi:flavodoxin family protein [Robiginitomaculum antarcticum]|uniref:flavodoxin family protein n=1 Tax=Robiginitomaculum antarcticum TaxID=437507 RepID=UPI00035E5132|nr:NAD(P)H-dependent oxidoreductase [Robiginitomaculum antarcticum]